ncbi:MAG TPA: hypothetical protein VD902_07275, partial [Symbiobacteriaceae bacterium]|nr:hypothetical protein [Symbiobacteriaceae bacterium]
MRRAAIIFEGGDPPHSDLHETLIGLRHAITLDTVEKYIQAGVGDVVLATNFPALATAAERLGARVWNTSHQQPFHFGKTLQQVVRAIGSEQVIYCSGAALPLISQAEIQWILAAMDRHAPCVVV